jgi:hypothetical protein
MRRLFPLTVLALFSLSIHAQNTKYETGRVVVINPPATELVFEGKDSDMPIDDEYLFAMPEIKNHYLNYSDIVRDIVSGLPHWMKHSVWHSRKDMECIVMVNDVDYFAIAMDFYMKKNELSEKIASWYAEFNNSRDYGEAKAKLQDDVCKYIKNVETRK